MIKVRRPFLLVVAFVVSSTIGLRAQDGALVAEIANASGTAEVLNPDVGWRRAVLGRRLFAGSKVTTWLDSSVSMSRGDSLITLGPLSHLEVIGVENEQLRLRLDAGQVDVVASEGLTLDIPMRDIAIVANAPSEYSASTREIAVTSGSVTVVSENTPELVLETGTTYTLLLYPFEMILAVDPR